VEFRQKKDARKKAESSLECRIIADPFSLIGFILAFASSIHNKQTSLKVGPALAKAAALRITLNLDGAPIISRTHTHQFLVFHHTDTHM
jgi:hypothetical protein